MSLVTEDAQRSWPQFEVLACNQRQIDPPRCEGRIQLTM